MSNKGIDLDTLTIAGNLGSGREVFDPDTKSIWPGASTRVYVQTHRANSTGGVIQIGYDPELDETFVRANSGAEGARWSDWLAIEAPPPPEPEIEEDEAERGSKSKAAARKAKDDEEESAVRSKKK